MSSSREPSQAISGVSLHAHTPGPWSAQPNEAGNHFYITIGGRYDPAVAVTWPRIGDEGQREANARLIAAAPDLLEALTIILRGLNDGLFPEGVYVKADAAVAKALGTSVTDPGRNP